MEKKFLTIDEVSQYLGVKKSNLYSKVERREIPFYRLGRLIMFKMEEVDSFMEKCRIGIGDPCKEAKRILKRTNSNLDIDRTVKKTIAEVKENGYTLHHGKSDRNKGLRKEVEDGTV